jgi:hypothetical protein
MALDLNGLQASLVKLAKMDSTPAPTTKTLTKAEFDAYLDEQLGKAETDTDEVRIARVKALREVVATAKASFALAESATFTIYTDPLQGAPPTTKTVEAPANLPALGDGNVQFDPYVTKNADVMKNVGAMMVSMSKHLADAKSVTLVELAKSEDAVTKALIEKAGSASSLLLAVAMAFGIDPNEADPDEYHASIAWQVKDIIAAVEQAAKVEQAMAAMNASFGALAQSTFVQANMDARKNDVTKSDRDPWQRDMTIGLTPKGRAVAKTTGLPPSWDTVNTK